MSTTTPNSVASRPILSVTNHLRGIDNFDEWHFELTTIVLQGEGLTAQATKCADVEVVWSMKGLRRALRVLDGDVKKLRAHQEEVVSRPSDASPLPPPTLDALPVALSSPVAEYLAEHRSTVLATARAAKGQMDQMVRTELADVERSCALVYASLSDSVRRDAAAANLNKCAHCVITWLRSKFCSEEQKHASAVTVYTKFHTFKFERHVSLEVNLGMFDKLRHSVEKLDGGRTLSDSHLSSALLASLPPCITPDLHVWRGARPSIPYAELRTLLAQHWHDLTLRLDSNVGASTWWIEPSSANRQRVRQPVPPRPTRSGTRHSWHL
ncbi:hypothetical protein H310_14980 [Aphanomyces invadans]|uniref:Uncharacterized protein n=1 Tax=Aphanomyces invadans TaxID=157072 RepID=A0A024T874_9STRA|nr:hypothetical protein H310_14980 [Aphanomyces invadans]ETV90183.1 hypothetical protein H310_14980 [Aphanomyces invadans]|eukprot:XP_008881182.1 hypothetical protein H310_14980 [Aphanomyces invadans]